MTTCKICKKKFEKKTPRQKYCCQDCGYIGQQMLWREKYYKKKKQKMPDKAKVLAVKKRIPDVESKIKYPRMKRDHWNDGASDSGFFP